jgi:predicted outer membrane protein
MVALFLSQIALSGPAAAQQQQPADGPLGPADIELLTKVRLAGLWEMPAGEWAEKRSENARVKEVGMTIMVDHGRLDAATRALAGQLGVPLPSQPNSDQQSWLNEMQNARTAAEFDQVFGNRLRAAHGQIFSVIAAVRAGTRNIRMREFATVANQAVMRHITLLESTGLVDYNRLPEAVTAKPAQIIDVDPVDVATVVGVAMIEILATVFLIGLLRKPSRRGTRRRVEESTSAHSLPADPFVTSRS